MRLFRLATLTEHDFVFSLAMDASDDCVLNLQAIIIIWVSLDCQAIC